MSAVQTGPAWNLNLCSGQARVASECWRKEINARIEKMERMRDRFTECIGCGCLSFEVCALVNPHDRLAEHGPGPHRLLSS